MIGLIQSMKAGTVDDGRRSRVGELSGPMKVEDSAEGATSPEPLRHQDHAEQATLEGLS